MAHPLNEQQAKAVAYFDADLLVTAGAGTGKTSVLTRKYLQLLEERRAGVNEIVAITFTNKAAAEMRDRIQQAVREYLRTSQHPEVTEYWQNQLLKLESARISTFHSFCLGLAREFPLEAGIPPVTGILNEGEEAIYLNQAITTVLTREFNRDSSDRPLLLRLLVDYGWERLANDLGCLYRTIRESGIGLSQVVAMTLDRLNRSGGYSLESLCGELEDFIEFGLSQKLTPRGTEVLHSFRERWPFYRELLQSGQSLETQVRVLTEIRKALPGNLPNVLRDRLSLIHEMLAGICRRLLDQECRVRLPVLRRLLEEIDREYSGIKLESGLVDFTDQQLLARNLLVNYPELAARIRQGIKYVLVDEFQDTNGLQMEIIGQLVGADYQGGRLMAVGDIKQSIYRFRGAEAELITDLGALIRERGGQVIALDTNYRSDRVIIDFINRISRRIFENEAFDYQPLQATKSVSGAGVEFLLTGTDDRVKEAQMIATRIAQLVRESGSGPNPVNYGDIVLLFRAGTSVLLYQQALQNLGIPYYNSCGGDFYHRQEIVDQINLLRLMEQRYDPLALLALLTSPYVGLSQAGLFWLSRKGDLVKEFYECAEFPAEISLPERERLRNFRELLDYLLQNRELLPIPAIIRIALERCDYREMLWASPNGSQRVANLEKLLAKADEFTTKGFHDLNRFLAYIAELEGMGILESEAPTEAELGNVVRLMTIHRAKGLEFPIVIIPELDRQFNIRQPGSLVFHKRVGLGMNIPLEEEAVAEPTVLEEIKRLNKREEVSELKRLLYVAMTRAKQYLILVGSGCSDSRGDTLETANCWMKWFELLLPLKEADEVFDFEGVPIRVARDLPEATAPPGAKTVLDRILPEIDDYPQAEKSGLEVAATAATKIELFRVTEILTYLNCPRRYFWQYRMRLNEPELETGEFEASGAKDNLGALIGNFMHLAAGRESDQWPDELWEALFRDRAGFDRPAVKKELERIWRNYRNSPYTEKAGKRWDEVPFLLKLTPELRVEGRFDRLLQNEAGELVLVDYKTHRVGAERIKEIAAPYYPQLRLYALAVKALWGKLPERAVLYFPYPNREVEVPLDRVSLDRLVAEIELMAEFVGSHHRPGDYPQTGKCEQCSYVWLCR